MKHYYTITEYKKETNTLVFEDSEGCKHNVDALNVCLTLKTDDCESLVGKRVAVSYLAAVKYLACGVELK